MKKTAVITGASSGIGLATANMLSKLGYKVYDLSRNGKSHDNISHISCDITDTENVHTAISNIISLENKIDILINNAGFGISGAIEYTDLEYAKKQLEVNFWGTTNMVKEVLPHMRKAKSGKIINISSVAAVVPIPFQAYYSISKSAINTYTIALANEIKRFNIQVSSIMPGDTKTSFTASREKIPVGDDVYNGVISRSINRMEKDEQSGMTPEQIATFICKIVKKKKVKPLYTIGLKYKIVVFLINILPHKLSNALIAKFYAE